MKMSGSGVMIRSDPSNETDMAVGHRIRQLRKARGQSLHQVAGAAGISAGFLSQVERGLSSASVRLLASIAAALEASIGDIFPVHDQGFDSGGVVARVMDQEKMEFPATGIVKRLVTPFDEHPRLDIYLIDILPGGRSGDAPHAHSGEEAGVVMEGGLELRVDRHKYVLGEGDSFRFRSSASHQFLNAGDKITRVVWVNLRTENEKPDFELFREEELN